ncbi:glycosyltransferase [Ferrimonas futtsuensis]|uniref:glycosyltransferase n=1 Tax=Ferrimonas futtsuensis TaxID=364764 RepID=UPI0004838939|nr:glycosyltransferase [Ferrimonas futtsuensis]
MSKSLVSVIIRTLNEEKHLDELLAAINSQTKKEFNIEVIIVDSGSTDSTLTIANKYGCRITYIDKNEFTFGRSLNIGCEFADGDYLVFISGHCIPCDKNWIENLVAPLHQRKCDYVYGRQLARDTTKFSEMQLFKKYFPEVSKVPQEGYFCNNANSAIRKDVWESYKFDETLTGCEDMFLAKQIIAESMHLGYVAEAAVFHIHDESWEKVKIRYEREAIALQKIMPEVHISLFDLMKFISIGIAKDVKAAIKLGVFNKEFISIICFRFVQYYGAYLGNHNHRKLSQQMKNKYFYPRVSDMNVVSHDLKRQKVK